MPQDKILQRFDQLLLAIDPGTCVSLMFMAIADHVNAQRANVFPDEDNPQLDEETENHIRGLCELGSALADILFELPAETK